MSAPRGEQTRDALSVGVVGCGYGAEQLHLPAIRSLPSVRVVAIADPDPDRLRLVGDRFAIERRYRDHEALLRDAEVEAVAVCTPPATHVVVTRAVLEARKHVLVEKPLCLDLQEADRLVDLARRTSVTAMVGFNLRFHRHLCAAREAVTSGFLGPVELVRTTWSSQVRRKIGLPEWRRHRDAGGGVLNEMAVHHVDLWRFLLGTEVDELFASSRVESSVDESATLTARLANGALAISAFSQCAAETHDIEIWGQQGRLLASPYRFDGLVLNPASVFPGALTARARGLLTTLKALPAMLSDRRHGGAFLASYRAEWEHFATCARHGRPADSTFEDGRRALELVQAAIESARTGRPVDVTRSRRFEGAERPA
jgi:myo-inositol 2-dehydrogenase / D-chiro-inositol 1-dehydrogenase